jgi:leucyl-tRNA synthetase
MTLVNEYYDKGVTRGDMKPLLLLLSPFAPHICEEMWERLGFKGQCSLQKWPEYDESKTVEAEKTIAVQVNGKLRSTVTVPADSDAETVKSAALADRKIAGYVEGMEIVKTIVVPNKLVNLILKPQA